VSDCVSMYKINSRALQECSGGNAGMFGGNEASANLVIPIFIVKTNDDSHGYIE